MYREDVNGLLRVFSMYISIVSCVGRTKKKPVKTKIFRENNRMGKVILSFN